ncbi:unnamed protein product [Bursaphelenchus xylophilus]|uniref:(pine wood nematode) hypothetical protein n=1 Tax=Bursaphelenchus xylophilus TaxID=6326 RepID=A0A1I7RNG2_BURXY|nr:unnamed protein product [Bursaphelenchus xylophilus]CAG9123981.1 unnamed protein product [Bursaphelenchus xylophilus]
MPSEDGLVSNKHGFNSIGSENIYGTNPELNHRHERSADPNSELETAISSSLTHLKRTASSPIPNSLRNNNFAQSDVSSEVVGHTLEPVEFNGRPPHYSKLKIFTVVNVVEIKKREKTAGYLKMSDRQVANPFRRYGSLRTLHSIGGWVTPKGNDKRHEYIKSGSRPPKRPTGPEFGLHKDANLNKEVVSFPCTKNITSNDLIFNVAQQIKKKVQGFESDLTRKPMEKKGSKAKKEPHNVSHLPSGPLTGIIRKKFSH